MIIPNPMSRPWTAAFFSFKKKLLEMRVVLIVSVVFTCDGGYLLNIVGAKFHWTILLTILSLIIHNLKKEVRQVLVVSQSGEMVLQPPLSRKGRFGSTVYETVRSRECLVHGFGFFYFAVGSRFNKVSFLQFDCMSVEGKRSRTHN